MAINPGLIATIKPTHVYIADTNYKETIFLGAIEDTTLIDLHGISIDLKSNYILQVFLLAKFTSIRHRQKL